MFDPGEFLGLAESLTRQRGDAHQRTAVGRAYYAAFLHVREKLGLAYVLAPRVHREVLLELLRRRLLQAANDLRLLRLARNRADYDLTATITRRVAGIAIERARALFRALP